MNLVSFAFAIDHHEQWDDLLEAERLEQTIAGNPQRVFTDSLCIVPLISPTHQSQSTAVGEIGAGIHDVSLVNPLVRQNNSLPHKLMARLCRGFRVSHQIEIALFYNVYDVVIDCADRLVLESAELVSLLNAYPKLHIRLKLLASQWKRWSKLHHETAYNARISAYVDVPTDQNKLAAIWYTEDISCLDAGVATLKNCPQLLKIPNLTLVVDTRRAIEIRKFCTQYWSQLSYLDKIGFKYRDVILDPMDPHRVSLSDSEYKIFLQDTLKYELYYRAIAEHAAELATAGQSPVKVLVVGPGSQGPLIKLVLKAFQDVPVDVWAIEKNFAAQLHLRSLFPDSAIHIIHGDAVSFDWASAGNFQFDLIVSELLGSFGCNEFAPEILARYRSPSTRMVPESVESYLVPVFASRFYKKSAQLTASPSVSYSATSSLFQSSTPQKVWEFSFNEPNEFDKAVLIKYKLSDTGFQVHGFMGYFKSKLAKGIYITNEPNGSNECKSWFPCWFKNIGSTVPSGKEISVVVTRNSSETNACYKVELVAQPVPT